MYWIQRYWSTSAAPYFALLMLIILWEIGASSARTRSSFEDNSVLSDLSQLSPPSRRQPTSSRSQSLISEPSNPSWKWRGRGRAGGEMSRRAFWQRQQQFYSQQQQPGTEEFSYSTALRKSQRGNPRGKRRKSGQSSLELLDDLYDEQEGGLQEEGDDEELGFELDSCCPTITEIIQPIRGKNRTGDLVELYHDSRVKQHFYEISCHPSVVNKHCRFLDKFHTRFSRCVQEHSWTYALVRTPGEEAEVGDGQRWALDYISVRSGCSCKVIAGRRRRRKLRKARRRIT